MTNIIFLFGTLAGLIIILAMIALMIAGADNPDSWWSHSLWLGYLIMLVALSMIFFAVKRYRDQDLGGIIKFLPAFFMGVGISVVAGIIYVLVWEVYLASTNYAFMDTYVAGMIEAERAKGTSAEVLNAMIKEFEALKVQYKDPLFRIPMTFLEIFPVGLLVALISALILRNPRVLPAQA
jgi:hypothetical protein